MKKLLTVNRSIGLLNFNLKMRFSMLLLLSTLSYAQANNTDDSNPYITINLKDVSVQQLIDKIENTTAFQFVYKLEDVNLQRKVSLNVKKEKLETVLKKLFYNTKTTFSVNNKSVYLTRKVEQKTPKILKNASVKRIQQESTITGVVSDDENLPLPGVNIIEKGTNNGVTSDFDGNYSIKTKTDNPTLIFSYIGFVTKEILVNNKTKINVQMVTNAAQLDEIVVTALGKTVKKEKLSYATQRVTTEDSNKARSGDISKQLGGRVAGLNITSNGSSGGLTSSSRIVIRGENSLQIGKNQPLLVIDGVPVSNNQDATGGSFRPGFGDGDLPTDFGNGLSDLNPDDIETIDVLKGANAAALYGSRAANGVIIITTKGGKGKKFGITINSGITFSQIFNTWDIQNTYGGGFNGNYDEFSGNNWGPAFDSNLLIPQTGSPEFPNASPFIKRLEFNDFFQTGQSINNNIAIQGSNENSNYRFSFTDVQRKGIVPNTDNNRQNISLKSAVNITDKFKIDFSASYTKSSSDNTPLQGFNPQSVIYPFIWGHNNFDLDWFQEPWKPGQEFIAQNYPISWQNNPWLIANENLNSFDRNRVFGNVKTTYSPNDKWSMFFRAGTDFYDDKREAQRPSGQAQFVNGMYREQNIRFQETNIDVLATYSDDLSKDFSISTSIGANTLHQNSSSSKVEGRRLTVPGLYTLSNIEDQLRPDQFESEKVVHSIYGTATLGWKNALFLDITGRNDWSSTLPSANNSYFYPSAGVSAVMSKLFKLPEAINLWKVRANLAQVGSDTDPFIINPVKSLGTVSGSVQNQSFIPISDLQPEKTNSFEVGTEISLFGRALNFEFNYYINNTVNQIIQIPISEASGYSAKLINAGKIKNEGLEFVLSATPIKINDFKWDVTVNWSRNIGTIEELTEGIDNFIIGNTNVNGGNVQARVGGRMGDIYGTGYLRSPEGAIIYRNGLAQRGNEIKKLGNYNPDWIAGLSSTISYKFINLSVLMGYNHGGEMVSRTTALLYRTGLAAETEFRPATGFVGDGVVDNGNGTFSPNTTNRSLQDYWRALKGDEGNIEANTYDASYFKIREISLGVDLGDIIDTKIIKDIEISAFATNVFIFTKSDDLRHIDPENLAINGGTLVPGFEYTSIPSTRNFGLNVKFKF